MDSKINTLSCPAEQSRSDDQKSNSRERICLNMFGPPQISCRSDSLSFISSKRLQKGSDDIPVALEVGEAQYLCCELLDREYRLVWRCIGP